MTAEYADSHGHLTMVFDGGEMKGAPRAPRPDELRLLVRRAVDAGVTRILVPSTDREDQRRAVETAEAFDGVYAAVGFHPHEAKDFDEDRDLRLFEELCGSKKVVAVGEIGLDYHYDHSPREVQHEVFERQLGIAAEVGLPVVIHAREADDDVAMMLRRHPAVQAVLHSFSSGPALLSAGLELGHYFSFSGMATFRNWTLDDAVRAVPLDRLLVETDSPYLAPVPMRGKRNEPAFVRYVAERLAAVRGVDPEAMIAATGANALRLFGPRLAAVR
jgi:TatD DNase family protein